MHVTRLFHGPVNFGFCAAFIAFAAGCGGPDVELGQVHGTVQMDGKPVPRAQVTFIPEGRGRGASGLANENGEYVMEYTPDAAGALVGPVTVQIRTRTNDTPETIPPKYNDKTELKAEVKSGRNVINFDLQSGGWKAKGTDNSLAKPQ
jgi:hypothetical protein